MTGSRVCPPRGRLRRYGKSLIRRGAPVFRNIGRGPNDRRLPALPSHGPSGGVSRPVRLVVPRARHCRTLPDTVDPGIRRLSYPKGASPLRVADPVRRKRLWLSTTIGVRRTLAACDQSASLPTPDVPLRRNN
jgi:hypothetical protein